MCDNALKLKENAQKCAKCAKKCEKLEIKNYQKCATCAKIKGKLKGNKIIIEVKLKENKSKITT